MHAKNGNGRLAITKLNLGSFTTEKEKKLSKGTFTVHFDHDDGVYDAYFKVELTQ